MGIGAAESGLLATGYESLEHDSALSVDAACDQFERAWQRGNRPAIESFLHQANGDERTVLLRELLLLEAGYRYRAGEQPQLSEYQSRFPNLDESWLARALLPQTVAGAADSQSSAVSTGAPPAIPGFEILGERGRGGMGVVCQARDLSLGRLVALKFLAQNATRDSRRLERFRREARAASALNHPAVCTLYHFGEFAGQPYLVLEWIEGQTLRNLIRPNPDLTRLLPIARQIAEALRVAHAAGIVHRDIKPENLMIRPDGYLKVLDFGLARLMPRGSGTPPVVSVADSELGLLLGTASYMSPEQARAQTVGSASDVFSLGIVLYELSTGQHPFQTGGDVGTLASIVGHEAIAPRRLNSEIPELLNDLILRMLAKDPRDRPTAAEIEATLTDLAGGHAITRPAISAPTRRTMVGRGRERSVLQAAFDSASIGAGGVICISGEPGIGKTAVVEDFLAELSEGAREFVSATGRCSERLAGTEAYLPVLEALDSLISGRDGELTARALRRLAPSWHAQLAPPNLAADVASRSLSQERLKREFLTLLDEVSRSRTLVVFLDDVHWADAATVDLLAYVATRCHSLRLLLVLTYRPSALLLASHPFASVKLELQSSGACRELPLDFLSLAELDAYMSIAFPHHRFPPEFVTAIFDKTDGNPLFMVDLLRYLRDQGFLAAEPDGWRLAKPIPDFQRELPESVRGMIQRMADRLSDSNRQLLLAASIQGPMFDSAIVAEVLNWDEALVEDMLGVLERLHGLVRLIREREFPDRTLSLRYRFVHVLYQNALFAALPPTRKSTWSTASARAIEKRYLENSSPVAAQLALLYENARNHERAAHYFRVATENAVRLSAHRDAIALADRGLASVRALPASIERVHRELALLVSRGVALVATQGFASAEVEENYGAALDLCRQVTDAASRFPVLYGLWNLSLLRCELLRCKELAEEMFVIAQGQSDPILSLEAHNVLQQPLFHLGELNSARRHQEQAMAIYDAQAHGALTDIYSEDPGVGCLTYGAVTLWYLGYPDQSLRLSRQARGLAERLSYPFNRARALYFSAFVRLCRREGHRVEELAIELMDLCREQGFSMLTAGGRFLLGWSLAERGNLQDGIAQMQEGLSGWKSTKALSHYPYHLALLADALGRDKRLQESRETLDLAIEISTATSECFYEAELHRLRGELALREGLTELKRQEAQACFARAINLARRQSSKSLELRAASSAARHTIRTCELADGHTGLRGIYDWFTEGSDTPDLREASELLCKLA
jgi:predicted ATPase